MWSTSPATSPSGQAGTRAASPARLAWAKRRRELFGFTPDPDYPTFPFHPAAKNAVLAFCDVSKDGVQRAGFIPCWIKPNGEPEPLGPSERGRAVADYVEQITQRAGLNARFQWDGDRVVIE